MQPIRWACHQKFQLPEKRSRKRYGQALIPVAVNGKKKDRTT